MKTFNVRIAAATLVGLAFLPALAVAQEQLIAPAMRLVPLDITGHYAVPVIKGRLNPARHQLLVGAAPFQEIAVATATPVIPAPQLSVACVVALVCP